MIKQNKRQKTDMTVLCFRISSWLLWV